MRIKKKLVVLLTLINLNSVTAEDNGLANSVVGHHLSLATALQAAEVSIVSCRKQGIYVSAAVVDSSGLLQVLLRDTNASPISTTLSQRKAYTAANFLKDTTQLCLISQILLWAAVRVFLCQPAAY